MELARDPTGSSAMSSSVFRKETFVAEIWVSMTHEGNYGKGVVQVEAA